MDGSLFNQDPNFSQFPYSSENSMDWDFVEESLLYQEDCYWPEEVDLISSHSAAVVLDELDPLPALQSFQIVIEEEPMLETAIAASEQEFPREESISPKQEEAASSSSWFAYMVDAQEKGRCGYFSWGCVPKEEELNEEFKVLNQWKDEQEFGFEENNGILLGWSQQRQPEENRALRARKTGQRYSKKRTKFHQNISLQVLRQYFAGSLKDAAKDIGVCPTTLKRICRQHGIERWPSRKIKKVDQSLKKLQRVIDSVHGAQGTIEIGSFYSAFPELNSVADNIATPEVLSPVTSQQSADSKRPKPAESSVTGVCENAAVAYKPPVDHPGTAITSVCENAAKNYLKPAGISSCRSSVEGGGFRVKASLGDENVRLVLQPNWGLMELKQEIGKRFSVDDHVKSICFKYLDEDGEWVHLSCDDDLEECKEMHRFSDRNAIRVSLHYYTQSF
ncbi:unnamed protein product [Linum tenue]|uniref:Uncharacterized protein n=1 Tax=Linum tenue TaxID=586396 RepID=A0AAV0PF07_9ROSI|nr:unnamed protein product [Linum tenue]